MIIEDYFKEFGSWKSCRFLISFESSAGVKDLDRGLNSTQFFYKGTLEAPGCFAALRIAVPSPRFGYQK